MFCVITVHGNIQLEYKPINPLSFAVAGIVGYAVGKASYVGTCREKFNNKLGPEFARGFSPPGFGAGGSKPGHK